MTEHKIYEIVNNLRERSVIEYSSKIMTKMSGTTDGIVYTITVDEIPKYVLKLDTPQNISNTEQFNHVYNESSLLQKLLYTDPEKKFILYSYITGTTHHNRGPKKKWLELLVKDLFNHYKLTHISDKWGRLEIPRESWLEFNERSLEGARNYVGSHLTIEDYDKVKSLLGNISTVDKKYLLHGDTGVHNFVFSQNGLVGVIDPSPIVGPVVYDFTYAFCSSPDDLNVATLFTAFELLNHKSIDRTRLIEEVTFQLYCRIGICAKVHPHDLNDYIKAWDYWKAQLAGLQ